MLLHLVVILPVVIAHVTAPVTVPVITKLVARCSDEQTSVVRSASHELFKLVILMPVIQPIAVIHE